MSSLEPFRRRKDPRRLAGPGEHCCLATDSGQLNVSVSGDEEPPDLGLDLVVAPLARPALYQPSVIVKEELRWPGVVAQGPPDREQARSRDDAGEEEQQNRSHERALQDWHTPPIKGRPHRGRPPQTPAGLLAASCARYRQSSFGGRTCPRTSKHTRPESGAARHWRPLRA